MSASAMAVGRRSSGNGAIALASSRQKILSASTSDVGRSGYRIPPTIPFVGGGAGAARSGVRAGAIPGKKISLGIGRDNALTSGDVGGRARSREVDFVPTGGPAGLHFGWEHLRGDALLRHGSGCNLMNATSPVDSSPTMTPRAAFSITGGYSLTAGREERGAGKTATLLLRRLSGRHIRRGGAIP